MQSRIFLVKMLAGVVFPGTCWTEIVWSWTHLWTEFAELNVMRRFWSHDVQPSNTGIIVIVDSCSFIDIRNRNTRLQNTPTKIAEIDNLFRSRICGPNLCLTGVKGSALLAFSQPTKRTSILKDNPTAYATEFK